MESLIPTIIDDLMVELHFRLNMVNCVKPPQNLADSSVSQRFTSMSTRLSFVLKRTLRVMDAIYCYIDLPPTEFLAPSPALHPCS